MNLQIPLHDCFAPELGMFAQSLDVPPLVDSPEIELLQESCLTFLLEDETEANRYCFPQGKYMMILMVRKKDARNLVLERQPDLDMKLVVLQHHTKPMYVVVTENIVSPIRHELQLHMGVKINGREEIHFPPYSIHTFVSV